MMRHPPPFLQEFSVVLEIRGLYFAISTCQNAPFPKHDGAARGPKVALSGWKSGAVALQKSYGWSPSVGLLARKSATFAIHNS